VIFALICFSVAKGKNKSAGLWAVLGFLFGPIAFIILLFASAELSTEEKIASAITSAGGVHTPIISGDIDKKKWGALVQFDTEIANAQQQVQAYGQQYVDKLAESYLALPDKQYLPRMVAAVVESAKADSTSNQRIVEDQAHAQFQKLFIGPSGKIVLLNNGQVLAQIDGQIARFRSVDEFRAATRDTQSVWYEVEDAPMTKHFANIFSAELAAA
jgi:hypothetical protein